MSLLLHSRHAIFIPLPHDISLKSGWKSGLPVAPLFAVDYESSWAPHEQFQDTRALWGNTNVF